MYKRIADLAKIDGTFFLWGSRQVGKSSLLEHSFPSALFIDLLESDTFMRYRTRPHALREELLALELKGELPTRVIIDEIQKAPELLDEVHWLIEKKKVSFALCGSSARKVRRSHANLLGGRAQRFELFGLTSLELGPDFNLDRMLNHGYLPRHYMAADPKPLLRAYCQDYLREEVLAEGLSRDLPAYTRFLEAAVLSDGEQLNFATIARDVGVSSPTVKSYFEILVDTLLASFLPAYTARPKRRVVSSPKFYLHDVGVVNHLAKRGSVERGGELYGKAFENWVHHELQAYRAYKEPDWAISYWRLSSGIEVDFVIDRASFAIEAKASERITSDHLRGLRELKVDQPQLEHAVVVCLEAKARRTDDGIDILPYAQFVKELWRGTLLR